MKESYDQSNVKVFGISKMKLNLLHRLKVDSLPKIINEDLTINHRK